MDKNKNQNELDKIEGGDYIITVKYNNKYFPLVIPSEYHNIINSILVKISDESLFKISKEIYLIPNYES